MKLYSFIISNEKTLSDFMIGSQDGLSESVHKGHYLVVTVKDKVIDNLSHSQFVMNVIKNRKSKIFDKAVAHGIYPIREITDISGKRFLK